MNSEELERSLRTDFERHFSDILAEMRQEVAEFQKKVETELEKHKSQLSEAFQDFSSKIDAERPFDEGFRDSITEHLRLAKDEGAQLSATAFAEAEAMQKGMSRGVELADLRDAINEISSQNSQSGILRALVNHAERYTERGVFFILRNEEFLGWQAMGRTAMKDASSVRQVNVPLGSDTVLGEACRSLSTAPRSGEVGPDDAAFLDALGFGRPSRMLAVPLIARGRGVAVLYADGGSENGSINAEALETLVRVASLTVELLASTQVARPDAEAAINAESSESAAPATEVSSEASPDLHREYEAAEAVERDDYESSDIASSDVEVVYEEEVPVREAEQALAPDTGIPEEEEVIEASVYEVEPEYDTESSTPVAVATEAGPTDFDFTPSSDPPYAAESGAQPETVEVAGYNGNGVSSGHPEVAETASDSMAGQTPRRPQKERALDLPIDVAEGDRPEHVKARRFARLLVSEINLYNEQKVKEGRESNDLYDRLREAIDRSREMYEKRVAPPVASQFDYFHYELVNSLAEGNAQRLGNSYPGAAV